MSDACDDTSHETVGSNSVYSGDSNHKLVGNLWFCAGCQCVQCEFVDENELYYHQHPSSPQQPQKQQHQQQRMQWGGCPSCGMDLCKDCLQSHICPRFHPDSKCGVCHCEIAAQAVHGPGGNIKSSSTLIQPHHPEYDEDHTYFYVSSNKDSSQGEMLECCQDCGFTFCDDCRSLAQCEQCEACRKCHVNPKLQCLGCGNLGCHQCDIVELCDTCRRPFCSHCVEDHDCCTSKDKDATEKNKTEICSNSQPPAKKMKAAAAAATVDQ